MPDLQCLARAVVVLRPARKFRDSCDHEAPAAVELRPGDHSWHPRAGGSGLLSLVLRAGGGSGPTLAGDQEGNPITLESWVKSHKENDRELVQGLKGEPYYLISTADNIKDFALLSVCTHLGCVVPWSKSANKFCCPCHGSQYDENGKVVRGPAPLSLALAHTTTQDGKLALTPWPEKDFRTDQDPWWK